MEVIINHDYENKEELKEIIKTVAEIEKEYSCNCTLNLNKLNYIELDPKNIENTEEKQTLSELHDIRKLIQLLVKIQLVCNFEGALNLKRLELFPVWIREELLDCMYLLHLDKKE